MPDKNPPKIDSSKFPCWRYGPDGAAAIFNSLAEIPEGWVDNPQDASAPVQMTGQEMFDNYKAAELRQMCKDRGIDFAPNADKATLANLLVSEGGEGDDS